MKNKVLFYCTDCGNELPKWQGQCPSCGAWNTIVEQPMSSKATKRGTNGRGLHAPSKARRLSDISTSEEIRFQTGMNELDRVLGGGAVKGSLVLIGGAPGIGKSTLMLQICDELCKRSTVLYASGEESPRQIKLRAERLGVSSDCLYLLSETSMEDVIEAVHSIKPDILIVDSIQTMNIGNSDTTPGSISQVKQCTTALMNLAKSEDITIFVIGHINKEGSIAGPKVLEHMVDCVLYFEGDQHVAFRILRAAKNRFGATNEIGVFEMLDRGLREIPNPSEMLLASRPENAPGNCVTCIMEGNRPVLAEVQALVAPSRFSNPRRTSNGLDYSRAMLLLAVLEKRGGLLLGGCDAYVNVVGGLYVDEPAADLAAVLALASSFRDRSLPQDLAAIGEVGLTGEIRSINAANQRLSEIHRLGFSKAIVPASIMIKATQIDGLQLIPVKNIREALATIL